MRVLTIGTFDLLHVGHLELFERCRALAHSVPTRRLPPQPERAYEVTVAVNTDDFVTRFKGNPPIINEEQRCQMIEAIDVVDRVVLNVGSEHSTEIAAIIKPDVIVIGDDWAPGKGKDYAAQTGFTPEWLALNHCRIEYVPRSTGQSTSAIKKLVLDREKRKLYEMYRRSLGWDPRPESVVRRDDRFGNSFGLIQPYPKLDYHDIGYDGTIFVRNPYAEKPRPEMWEGLD